ncbi:MAG: arginine--tRNA ligase [Dehalococcoidia bacterium]|nr:MAG: arginine--tRNA ligase [Dehalococcoidia bacterium]
MTIKEEITELLEKAANEAIRRNLLPPMVMPDMLLERPQNPEHGDYASPLALKLARAARMNPLIIAESLASLIQLPREIERIAVAPPGFINFSLRIDWLTRQVEEILSAGEEYGNIDLGKGARVQLEVVSVNPTGPLHLGHGRGAILGSTLANVLAAVGYQVNKEYYINDAGSQMDAFYRSLYTRYQQALGIDAQMPSEGYFGEYLIALAREIAADEGRRLLEKEAIKELGRIGMSRVIDSIKSDLELLGVSFDVWFSEESLFDHGQYERAMSLLSEKGYTGEKEGATWFVSTALGEDKDNVLVRSDGSPTYFASDIAYHYNKFIERGFDRVINIWGADHQGHVSRMKAAVGALGIDPERLQIIISQMVTLKRGESVLRLSKRTGELITLRELVGEVGADACRFFFLSRSADSQMDFDLELAKRQSADNPVYYIQYAHARIASILRLAQERGIDYRGGDVSLLTTEPELTLIRRMLQLPEVMEMVASTLEPHHLSYYATDIATIFHDFYEKCRVISPDEALTWARLKLVEAAKIVLAKTLRLMGMTAPDRM